MTKTKVRGRAGIYVRLSRDREHETSTERQEIDARALCEAKGYEVADVYADVGLSGYSDVQRPQYRRLLADVRAGTIDTIVVWKLDRLTRRGIREIAPLLDLLEDTGARLVAVQDSIDTSTPMGEAVLGLLASLAKQESSNISVRTRTAKAHAAQRGQPAAGGRRAFGYTDTILSKTVRSEVKLLTEARDRVFAGESLRSIANDWNDRGIVTVSGANWTSSNLGRTLRGPHLAALRVHNTEGRRDVHPATWPAVFTVEEHHRLLEAAGNHFPAALRRHLLTGFLRCGVCDATLRSKTTARFGRQYSCPCGRVTVNADAIEEAIAATVAATLDSPAARDALQSSVAADDVRHDSELLAADQEALRALSHDFYVDRSLTRDEFTSARVELVDRIDLTERRVSAAANAVEPISDPITIWDQGDVEDRRLVLARVVDQITVNPTTMRGRSKFDVERIKVTWRN